MSIHPTAVVSPSARDWPGRSDRPFLRHRERDGASAPAASWRAAWRSRRGRRWAPTTTSSTGPCSAGCRSTSTSPNSRAGWSSAPATRSARYVTVHRALVADHATTIGDHCLLMVGVHVAHDCHLGNHVILTNNVMLAGHVDGRRSGLYFRGGGRPPVLPHRHVGHGRRPGPSLARRAALRDRRRAEQSGGRAEQDRTAAGGLQPGRHPGPHGGLSGDLPQRAALGRDPRAAPHALPRSGRPRCSTSSSPPPPAASSPSVAPCPAPPSSSATRSKPSRKPEVRVKFA